jgi:hypothetical protein
MYKTINEASQEIKKLKDVKKQNELDAEIDDILNRIKTLVETGWTSIKKNQFSRMAIIPLSYAVRDRLSELEGLILEHQDVEGDPDLREKIRWLRSLSGKKRMNPKS